jgi:Mg2+ and Co2+ transporter CorA
MTLQTIGIVIGLVVTWSGFLIGVIKWLLDRNLESYNREIEQFKKEVKDLKSEVAVMKQELPVSYVRRSDFQRCRDECVLNVTTLEKKLDDFFVKMLDKLDELRKEVRYAKTQ